MEEEKNEVAVEEESKVVIPEELPDAMVNKNSTFFGNPLLKREYEDVELTPEHIEELRKCLNDPVYFAERYMKIVNVDTGLQTIKLYDYQKRILTELNKHRYNIILSCRQSGKCVVGNTKVKIRKHGHEVSETTLEDIFNGTY